MPSHSLALITLFSTTKGRMEKRLALLLYFYKALWNIHVFFSTCSKWIIFSRDIWTSLTPHLPSSLMCKALMNCYNSVYKTNEWKLFWHTHNLNSIDDNTWPYLKHVSGINTCNKAHLPRNDKDMFISLFFNEIQPHS